MATDTSDVDRAFDGYDALVARAGAAVTAAGLIATEAGLIAHADDDAHSEASAAAGAAVTAPHASAAAIAAQAASGTHADDAAAAADNGWTNWGNGGPADNHAGDASTAPDGAATLYDGWSSSSFAPGQASGSGLGLTSDSGTARVTRAQAKHMAAQGDYSELMRLQRYDSAKKVCLTCRVPK